MRALTSLLLGLALVAGVTGCTPLEDDVVRATAVLDDSAGLFEGNDVGILGVPVGSITDITPAGETVEVEFELHDTSVPASVGAVVVARSVATDRYLELTPVDAPGPALADGDTIPLERTRTPAEFDDVLASLQQLAEGLRGPEGDAAGLRALLANGADALEGRGATVNRTIVQLAEAMDALSEERGDIAGTIDELDRLTALVAGNQELVDEFVTSVTDATELFADESESFGRALDTLGHALRTLARFVREHREQLGGSVRALTRTTRQLLEHERALAETIEVLPLTFENIGRAVDDEQRLQVRLPLQHLSPAQQLTGPLCEALPGDLCNQLGTDPSLADLLALLSGSSPGGGRR